MIITIITRPGPCGRTPGAAARNHIQTCLIECIKCRHMLNTPKA